MASHSGGKHTSSRPSKKGKQPGAFSSPSAPKAAPSTAVTPSSKGLPEPGIFQTRPSQPLHTCPSFERGRQSTKYGDIAPETTSAHVTGADGQGEASYSRAGSQNTAQWEESSGSSSGSSSSSSSSSSGPGGRRRRRQAHPADTTYSEAYRAVGVDYTHARDPEFWEQRRLRREATIRRQERRERRERRETEPRRRESSEACCTLF